MGKINTLRPIRFFDDRCKSKDSIYLTEILFEDEYSCLGHISVEPSTYEKILFSKLDGTVLSINFQFFIAENYITVAQKKADEAIKFIRGTYVNSTTKGIPSLLLGDVVELVKLLTAPDVCIANEDITKNKE